MHGPDLAAARAQLLADYPPAVADLTRRLRAAVLSAVPDATERVYLGWRGIGFHHPDAGYVCAIFPGADRVRVGFERGHLLDDPDQLLEGTGTRVRYLTVTAWDPDLTATLEVLLDQAISLG